MSNKTQDSAQPLTDAAALRQRAEAHVRSIASPALSAHTPEEIQQMVHELRVHQIELEMQNEELRTAQATIEAGRARYFDLYDLAPVGYCAISEKGLIQETNLTACALLGVARSALLKQLISRFILREDQDIYHLQRKKLFATGEDQEYDLRLVKPDGTFFWAQFKSTVALADDGTPVCRVTFSDITERKQAEEKLQQSKDMICLLLDSTAEAIYGVDPQGACTFCNAACVRILGYDSADQIIGRNMHNLIHHSHADGTPMPAEDCVLLKDLDRQFHSDREKFWCADGSSFPVEYWSYPIYQENKTIGQVVSFMNIAERRQAQRLLNQQKTQLEQQNKALKQFSFIVSHELKTPLVSIESSLGLIQSTQSQTMDPELTLALGYARHAARQMHNMLESLLLMFRIDAADNESETTAFGVLVQAAVDQLTRENKLNDIKVKIVSAGLDLCGDRGKLGQIWLQLIENAAKFMGEQKHPVIDIGVGQMDQEVLFYVRDNGMGIEQPYQGKIFGLFDQLDKTVGGTGMGLTLVQRIVDYYGGTVRVESAGKGAGSCFYFTLRDVLINEGATT